MTPAPAVKITAIVTAYRRIAQTVETLQRIEACEPAPDEILIHVDGNEQLCADAIRSAFPHLGLIVSQTPVGPGGGRNKLVAAARNELIASFDDDSYPIDTDYFGRACSLMQACPETSLFAAVVFHRSQEILADAKTAAETSSFGAGGMIVRRSDFLAAGGFVPLVVAYGMEEEDLALRLIDQGKTLAKSPWLRVFHDTDLSHHASAAVTSGSIANLALLAYLRYPRRYWLYGGLQVANRVVWCARSGRTAGLLTGLASIPRHIARHRALRKPVSPAAMRARLSARRSASHPMPQTSAAQSSGPGTEPL
jgi:GT2 family glycosyltransferase